MRWSILTLLGLCGCMSGEFLPGGLWRGVAGAGVSSDAGASVDAGSANGSADAGTIAACDQVTDPRLARRL